MKVDSANKEMEEAMKRVREAQSLISAAIEPGSGWIKVKTACLFFFGGGGVNLNWYFDTYFFLFCFCRQGEQEEAIPLSFKVKKEVFKVPLKAQVDS